MRSEMHLTAIGSGESWHLETARIPGDSGRTFVIAIIDPLTRQCIAHDLQRERDAKAVIGLLDRVAWARGAPKRLVVDRSGLFGDAALDRWAARHQTQMVSENPRRPGAKGQVERVLRSLIAALADGPRHHKG